MNRTKLGVLALLMFALLAGCEIKNCDEDALNALTALSFTTSGSLPNGIQGTPYSQSIRAAGGVPGYNWALTGGALPPGLTLTGGTPDATVSGTPTATGVFTFTIEVTDSAGNSITQQFTIIIPALAFVTTSLPDGFAGAAYNEPVEAAGGTQSGYTFTVTAGTLPPGLTLADGTPSATLSGNPSTTGDFDFTLEVQDSGGNTASQDFTIRIPVLAFVTATVPDGAKNSAYSVSILCEGGTGAGYTFSVIAGALPTGLGITDGTPGGTLAGTPSVFGTGFTFTLRVTDSGANTATQAFTMDIAPAPLQIVTASLPDGQQDAAYSQNITAQGGTEAGYTFSLFSGTLPPGLSLADGTPTGTLSGTPNAFAVYNFTLQVTDSGGNTDTQSYTVAIAPPPLVFVTTTLPDGDNGQPYSEQVTASGGTGAGYTFSVVAGALPGGLGITDGTPSATLSGTPNANGVFNFTLQVTDSGTGLATQPFTITISLLRFVTTALPNGGIDVPYSEDIFAAGGTGTGYSFTLEGGTLPDGLTLSSGTPAGLLSGTPTVAGPFNFTLRVTDSGANTTTQAFSMDIAPTALQITTETLPDGMLTAAYNQPIAAVGGTGAGYTWSLASGSLPTSLTLTSGTPNATLSGTPTASAYFTFSLRVQDSGGNIATRQFVVRINVALTIPAFTMPGGKVGVEYSQPVVSSGGAGFGYVWTLDSGTLPPGLGFNANGQFTAITGEPMTTVGSPFNFTLRVTDGDANTATRAFTINIVGNLTITTLTLADGTSGTAYNQSVTASGGSGAGYAWSVVVGSGTGAVSPLPTGLALTASGTPATTLAGTPTGSGVFSFIIRVTDSLGARAERGYTVNIAAVAGALQITTASPLPAATAGAAYTTNIVAINGTGTHAWVVFAGSALPGGLGISGSTGTMTLSGTPLTSGTFTFTIQVTANSARATKTFTLVINGPGGPPVVTTTSLPRGRVGEAYSGGFLTGAYGTLPYSWVILGPLPAGITLDNTSPVGGLTGAPMAGGTFNITIQLTDGAAQVATRAVSLVIDPAVTVLTITTTALPDGMVGQQYGTRIDAVGGAGGYTWSATPAGSLPGGLDIFSGTPYGALGGIPFVSGIFTFTVRVADSGANVDTQELTIRILPAGVPLDVTTEFLPYGVLNTAYSADIVGTGGSGIGYNWVIEAGYLPPGLTLTSGTPAATLSGTPELHGMFYFCVKVTDSDGYQTRRVYRLLIGSSGHSLRIVVPSPLPPMVAGQPFSMVLYGTGGTGTGYAWSSITIPGGFILTPDGSGAFATLSAAAPTTGNKTFNIQLVDSAPNTTQTGNFTITPTANTVPILANINLTTQILPSAFIGRPYNFTCGAVAGGTGTGYVWTHIGGVLPPGLRIVPRGYLLHLQGTPLALGTFTFTVKVADSAGASSSAALQCTVADIVQHYGAPVRQRAVFVADRSGSMGGARYNTLKLELVTNILAMLESDQFDIVPYSSLVETMWGQLRHASPANKAEALAFVEGTGLTPAGNTATYPALNYALTHYPTDLLSLFLVSDGDPTRGGTAAEIVRDTPVWFDAYTQCEFTGVGVQAIGAFEQFMMQLAAELQGLYVSR